MASAKRRRAGSAALLCVSLVFAATAAGAESRIRPAAGGAPLLAAAEQAQAVVVGLIQSPVRIDLHGYQATLSVEQVLVGEQEPGDSLRIGWEEISTRRPPRFNDGEQVVVALEALPTGTLWNSRFPKRDGLAVAARGEAFVRAPDLATLDALARYLALDPAQRDMQPGAVALAQLAGRAPAGLASAALARLDEIAGLDQRLGPDGIAALAGLVSSEDRSQALREEAIDLIRRRPLRSLRGSLIPLARPESGVEAPALAALAGIDHGLPAPQVEKLLERPEAALREVAARHGGAGISVDQLMPLLDDPSPEVRAAAVEGLVERQGEDALDTALHSLRDDDPRVRNAAARSIAFLGSAAVPNLRGLLEDASPREEMRNLAAPALTLALTGPDGELVLREIAAGHPDDRVRKAALFALGRIPEH